MLANKNCGQARHRSRSSRADGRDRMRQALCRPACTVRSGADKVFRIKRLSMVCAGYPHACQQNLWTSGVMRARGGTSRRVTVRERCFAGRRWPITRRVPHSKRRGQSVSDQALDRAMRRLSTCLPTKSVGKWRTTRIVRRASPSRRRGIVMRCAANRRI